MSTFEKRAREAKRNQKARGKAQRRVEKRNAPPSTASEFTTVAEIVGTSDRSKRSCGHSRAMRKHHGVHQPFRSSSSLAV